MEYWKIDPGISAELLPATLSVVARRKLTTVSRTTGKLTTSFHMLPYIIEALVKNLAIFSVREKNSLYSFRLFIRMTTILYNNAILLRV